MSIDFTGVKTITIPEGNVKKIVNGSGTVLWEKPSEAPSINFIDYIENTSNANYVDTGFKPNQNSTLVVEVEALATTQYCGIAGCRDTTYSFCFFTNTTTYRSDYYNKSTVSSYSIVVGDRVTLKQDKNYFYINDVQYNDFAYGEFQVTQNIWLLGNNNRGSKMNAMKQKFYSAQIYDNGTLVRDFRPCTDSNGTTCVFESVENKYYYLDGTNKGVN